MMNEVIITAPSLDPTQNVSGVSSVVKFIIDNNRQYHYTHFEIGKKDSEKGGANRIISLTKGFSEWRSLLKSKPEAIVHYSFPLSTKAILRDPLFIKEAIRQRHRVVVHIHGGLFLTAKTIPIAQSSILRRVFSWDVPFVVLSEMEKELVIKRFGAKRVEVLPNCVESPTLTLPRREGENEYEKVTLGYLGRIEANKGMEELLAACRQLLSDGIDFRLEIAGKEEHEGTFLPQFEKLLGSRFHYAGIVSGQSKTEFFRRMDIFVMPSYFEGLPISLLESMSYGIVPVVTPVGSIPQVVTNGLNGLLVNVKEVEGIVDVVKRLSKDRRQLLHLGQAARETIVSNFSKEKYIGNLNEIYKSLR